VVNGEREDREEPDCCCESGFSAANTVLANRVAMETKKIEKYDMVIPNEGNGYCLFREELENNPLVLFHATPKDNFELIASDGFKPGEEPGRGDLNSLFPMLREVPAA
jgi:hypothetical protein|tara:strand:- start:198 stop:521 length:324 start_codon:yes stop_codon:yes gene_type:complete